MFKGITNFCLCSSIIMLLFFSSLVVAQYHTKTRIAVFDFDAKGISLDEAKTLTERFGSTLVATEKFIVVERQKIYLIMEEIGLQMTGVMSEESISEAGKLLGVQKVITGSIGQIEETYTVDLRVIDVESGKVSGTISRNTTGSKENLIALLERLAKRLAGLKVEEASYTIKIFSIPGNSSVSIDGKYIGLTPLDKEIEEGVHQISVKQDGYNEWTAKVEIFKDEKITAKLEKKSGFSKWLWIGGGTLVAGGGILAAVLLGGKESKEDKGQPIGSPPDPPQN